MCKVLPRWHAKSKVGFEQKDRTSLSRIELGSDHMQSEGFHDWATQQLSDVGRIHTLSNLWKVGSKIGSGLLVRRNIDASDFTKYDVQSPNKITLLMHKGCGSMTQPTRIKTGIKITTSDTVSDRRSSVCTELPKPVRMLASDCFQVGL